ncbi:MAG: hypothetical protein KAX44_09010 [Candidatus Brocadiae bacterium]|nr:hypothetical protein [Candidatus Brocadiia bacterium]
MSRREVYRKDRVTVWFTPAGKDQMHVVASVAAGPADGGQACEDAYRHIADVLAREEMQIVHERLFGSLTARESVLEARGRALSASVAIRELPLTYIEGRPLWGEGPAGVQLHAVRPRQPDGVRTIYDGGVPCGRAWERSGGRFLLLQNIHGRSEGQTDAGDRESDATRMFERASRILLAQGASYRDVVQTWVYLSDILAWYDQFNQVRNAEYSKLGFEIGVSSTSDTGRLCLPASTGIRGENPFGAACVMDLLAIVGEPGAGPEIVYLSNVKQNEAYAYGSAFSRGACVREPDVTHIQVSGTAAIDESGTSLFPGDVRAQINRTLDTVEALVAQDGATLDDICEATVFLKRAEDAPVYREVAEERGLLEMPAVCVVGDVCRDELLFEMDGAAVVDRG